VALFFDDFDDDDPGLLIEDEDRRLERLSSPLEEARLLEEERGRSTTGASPRRLPEDAEPRRAGTAVLSVGAPLALSFCCCCCWVPPVVVVVVVVV